MLRCSTPHPQVRPPLRGLLKVLASSHPGNALLNIQKHLIRWAVGLGGGGSSKAHVKPAKWATAKRKWSCVAVRTRRQGV